MLVPDNLPSYEVHQDYSPNVLVVGETGVGKSSVINLIAGERLADVSSSASGCTMEASPYDIVLNDSQELGHHIRLYDTVGLNEPTLSKNDYFTAIQRANTLITRPQRTGGIRLLMFCIRGRITSVTQYNYRLFRDVLCQNQVPVAFVITGMEGQQPMESWWHRNAALFEKAKLSCASHVCVTATPGLNNVYASQYAESQTVIHRMLLNHMSGASWKPERTNWFVYLAGKLLKWVANIKDRKRSLLGRPKTVTVEELAWNLEHKCGFCREEAVELAKKIWDKRTECDGSEIMKGEDSDYLSDSH